MAPALPLLFSGVMVIWPLAHLLQRPVSGPRLLGETFVTTVAVIAVV